MSPAFGITVSGLAPAEPGPLPGLFPLAGAGSNGIALSGGMFGLFHLAGEGSNAVAMSGSMAGYSFPVAGSGANAFALSGGMSGYSFPVAGAASNAIAAVGALRGHLFPVAGAGSNAIAVSGALRGTFPIAGAASNAISVAGVLNDIPTFLFVGSTNSNAATFTLHGSAAAGDIAVMHDYATNTTGTPAAVQPGGNWTSVGDVASGTSRGTTYARILTAGDITTGTFTGMDGTSQDRKICNIFRPSSPVSGFTARNVAQVTQNTNPASQSLVTTSVATPAIAVGQMAASGAVDPRTISPAMSEVVGIATNHYSHYKVYRQGATPETISYDMADEGNANLLQIVYLDFTVT